MTTEQKIILLKLFHEVDIRLVQEQDRLLNSGIEPDTYGNHSDERWQALREIQMDKEDFQENLEVLGKDAWSFDSKLLIGEKRKEELIKRINLYKDKYFKS
jgi:hypothetical protein